LKFIVNLFFQVTNTEQNIQAQLTNTQKSSTIIIQLNNLIYCKIQSFKFLLYLYEFLIS